MEQPNYYAVIPANIRYDKDLKPMAKLLYGEISALTQKDGKCWATNKYFAELYGLTKETISRLISSLVKKHYITIEIVYKEGIDEIDKRYIQICQEGIDEKINRGIDEKVKENNTSNKQYKANNISNEFDIYNNYTENISCECVSKSTHTLCKRRSSFNINGKNYCNQHARNILGNYFDKLFESNKDTSKPTLEEIQEYINEKQLDVDAQRFFDYFEATNWVDSKGNRVKSWKGKLLTWSSYGNKNNQGKSPPQRQATSNPFLEVLLKGEKDDETGNNGNTSSNESFVSTILSDYTIE